MAGSSKAKTWTLKPSNLILPALAVLGMGFAIFTVFFKPVEAARIPATPPPRSPAEGALAAVGVVEPRSEIIQLGVELPGIVRSLNVKVGQDVTEGEVLLALDQRDIDAEIARRQAVVDSARIQAADALALYKRISNVDDTAAVSAEETEQRQYALKLADARVKEAQATLEAARTTKSRLTLTAPIPGRILELNVRPGEFVGSPSNQVLISLGDVSRLHVRAEVDEEFLTRLSTGTSAYATFRGDARKYPLSFVRSEPYVRPKQNLTSASPRVDTRVAQVVYALPEDTRTDFVGQQMDVFIGSPSEGTPK